MNRNFKNRSLKTVITTAVLGLTCSPAFAGGLLTNTNQNIAFNRNFARDGVIAIDGVYSNPAGVAFLEKGWHLSFNFQNAYQTRTIESGVKVPAANATPFYEPFKLNGGDANGVKTFVGKASVPILPSFQGALNYEKWGFQVGFGLIGGGGKASFNDGLGSFERQIALIPASLAAAGLTSSTPAYSVNSYLKGQQYIFGLQLGTTYRFNDHLAAYAGMRFNYVYNKYTGSITGITANIAGRNEVLFDYFGARAAQLNTQAAALTALAEKETNVTLKARYQAGAAQATAGAQAMTAQQGQVKDRHLECTQTGWGVTPIVGLDYKVGKWNFGTRVEFNTHLNIENDTKVDDTGLFKHGVNTPSDLPGLWTVGTQYSILDNLRVMGSYHYYFDKSARMANDKQKLLGGNTQEFLAGVEWDVTPNIMLSAGGQRTHYSLGDGSYLTDMSFVTSSYSIGFGAQVRLAKNMKLNVAYFWTNYEHFDKAYTQQIVTRKQPLVQTELQNTDRFTRTNKVLGVGLDIDI